MLGLDHHLFVKYELTRDMNSQIFQDYPMDDFNAIYNLFQQIYRIPIHILNELLVDEKKKKFFAEAWVITSSRRCSIILHTKKPMT